MAKVRRLTVQEGDDTQLFLDARRRRAARNGSTGRVWSVPLENGSIEELRHALGVLDQCVDVLGEWVMPLVEKLETEIHRRESSVSALDRSRQRRMARA